MKSEFASSDPLFPTSSAAAALLSAAAELLCWLSAATNSLHRPAGRRMSEADALIDGMDWGPGSVTEGTAEADDAKNTLISAVLTQDGSGAAKEGESEASRLWRCGTLRSTEPDAAPMLRRAIEVSDAG